MHTTHRWFCGWGGLGWRCRRRAGTGVAEAGERCSRRHCRLLCALLATAAPRRPNHSLPQRLCLHPL
eukprot:2954831-Pyramimonas_sp.AAC.2